MESLAMRSACILILTTIVFVLASVRPAAAVVQFYKVFEKEYLDTHADRDFAELVNKGTNKCYVCHQGRKSKKNHNAFGKHLVELLDRKKDMKNIEKISASLKTVLAMHIDPKDATSETYADRLKASKWPGGELEELKKEPAPAEGATAAK
jgi:cytochrome c2